MRKKEPEILEIPCLIKGCDFSGTCRVELFSEDWRRYKREAIRTIINQLKYEHERGNHVKCDCHDRVSTAVCHCRCCHCGGIS